MSSSRRSMKSLSTPAGSRKINNGRFAATDIIDTDDGAADIDVTCHCTVIVRIQAPLFETIDAAHSSRKLNCLRGCQTEKPSFGMTGLMLRGCDPGFQRVYHHARDVKASLIGDFLETGGTCHVDLGNVIADNVETDEKVPLRRKLRSERFGDLTVPRR